MVEYNKLITRDFSPQVTVHPWESSDMDKWEKQRQELSGNNSLEIQRFGSSETGAICGVNKYEGKFTFFQIKVGKVVGFEGTIGTDVGNILEPIVADFFQYYDHNEDVNTQKRAIKQRMKSGEKLREVHKANFFLTNSEYPNLFSSIDFIMPKESGCPIDNSKLESDALIEIKNIGHFTNEDWKKQGFISEWYYVQILQQMLVSGLKHAYLLAFVENQYLVLYKVTPLQEWFNLIVESANDMSYRILAYRNINEVLKTLPEGTQEYVDLVEQRDALEPEVGIYDDTDVIKNVYNSKDDSVITGDEQDLEYALNYLNEHEAETEAKKGKTLNKNLLLQRMKGASKMEVVSDGSIYVISGGSRFSIKRKEIK